MTLSIEQSNNRQMKSALLASIELIGIGLMGYGAWLCYEPAGYVLVGFLLWFEVNQNVFTVNREARTIDDR